MKCLFSNHFLNLKTLLFEKNAFNIIVPYFFYKKIYLIVIFEDKYLFYLSLNSAFRAFETKIYENHNFDVKFIKKIKRNVQRVQNFVKNLNF